jgi:uncharacterized membrane protein YgcG
MKHLAIVLALAALGGCATYPPAPAYYGSRAYAAPGEWQTVSVTPVPLGTGAAAAASGQTMTTTTGTGADPVPTYLPPAGSTTVVQQPIYAAPPVVYGAPVYAAPAPVYVAPDPWYWWPPISIGLGFSWNHWSGGHGGWHGGHGGGWHGGGGAHHR